MSDYINKPNNGSLWTEKSKKSTNSPDVKGKFKVKLSDLDVVNENGEQVAEMKLSGWRKKAKNGDTYISLSLNTYKKDEASSDQPFNDDKKETNYETKDDIPF